MDKKRLVIAEVKTASPFGWQSEKTWDELFAIANDVGDILSIHTDPRWDGSMDLIRKARALTDKPILAKSIHANDGLIAEAIDAGANFVLVVGRVPGVYQERCLFEPLSLEQLKAVPEDVGVVWNSRDLATGEMKDETFAQARSLFKGWLCQASNIRTAADIEDGADAVLVGTYLESFAASLKA